MKSYRIDQEIQKRRHWCLVLSWRKASGLAHPFLPKEFLEQEAYNVLNVYPALAEIWVTEIDGAVVGFIALVESEIGGLFLVTCSPELSSL